MQYTRTWLEELVTESAGSRMWLVELLEEYKRVPKTGDYRLLYPGMTVYFKIKEGEKWVVYSAVITAVEVTTVRLSWDCKYANEKHGDVYSTFTAAARSHRLGTVLDAKISRIDDDGNQWVEIDKTMTIVYKHPGGLKDGKMGDPVTMTYVEGNDGGEWRMRK